MIYMKLQGNVFPYFQGDVRLEVPEMGEEFVLPEGFVEVEQQPAPDYDQFSQTVDYGVPYEESGSWKVDMVVRQMTTKEQSAASALPSSMQKDPELAKLMRELEQELGLGG